jgi:hypothetical protein
MRTKKEREREREREIERESEECHYPLFLYLDKMRQKIV